MISGIQEEISILSENACVQEDIKFPETSDLSHNMNQSNLCTPEMSRR